MKSTEQRSRHARGMTLIETVLAMTITAMVGASLTTMMAAVTDEVTASQDTRSSLIRAGLAQSRLSSYIARAHCVLDLEDDEITLWLEDSRDGGSVHASEVRWIKLDSDTGIMDVHFICFPNDWSEPARLLADTEYTDASSTDWKSVLSSFSNRGLICKLPLIEGVNDLELSGNTSNDLDVTLVEAAMILSVDEATEKTFAAESIRVHQKPDEEN
ncbi:MAG: prepilin-type N-terminal cleavage/methylation domain-containing protein [Phycisphaerales bacterium]|nr:prepilin-type N-terminal cleavage/methylation domain-containing protein [Phycisphaerales bacterium]